MLFYSLLLLCQFLFSSECDLILAKDRKLETPIYGYDNGLLAYLATLIKKERGEIKIIHPLFEEQNLAVILSQVNIPVKILVSCTDLQSSPKHNKRKLHVLQSLCQNPYVQLHFSNLAAHQKNIIFLGQKKIVSGSMNLTLSGTQQEEHLVVISPNQKDLERALSYYEKIWSHSVPIDKVEDDIFCIHDNARLVSHSLPKKDFFCRFKVNIFWPIFGVKEPSFPFFDRLVSLIEKEENKITILTYSIDHRKIIESLMNSLKENENLSIEILAANKPTGDIKKSLKHPRLTLYHCHDLRNGSMHQKLTAFNSQDLVVAGSCNLSHHSAAQFNDQVIIKSKEAVNLIENKANFLKKHWTCDRVC